MVCLTLLDIVECCIQFESSIDGRLFYLIWMVSRSYDVKLLGVETLEHGGRLGLLVFGLVLMFGTVWCVIFFSCGSCILYFGREGVPQLEE